LKEKGKWNRSGTRRANFKTSKKKNKPGFAHRRFHDQNGHATVGRLAAKKPETTREEKSKKNLSGQKKDARKRKKTPRRRWEGREGRQREKKKEGGKGKEAREKKKSVVLGVGCKTDKEKKVGGKVRDLGEGGNN